MPQQPNQSYKPCIDAFNETADAYNAEVVDIRLASQTLGRNDPRVMFALGRLSARSEDMIVLKTALISSSSLTDNVLRDILPIDPPASP